MRSQHKILWDSLPVLFLFFLFPGKSHTDPILEDPLGGREPLLQCMLERMWGDVEALAGGPASGASPALPQHWQTPHSALVPDAFLRMARWVNPF